MAASVSVSISGPALSFLLFENSRCKGNQSGFLLGGVLEHVTKSINDSQICSEKQEFIISVNSILPVPNSVFPSNGIGQVDKDQLNQILDNKRGDVVGWYIFRRCTSLNPTLREKLYHKELRSLFTHLKNPDHLTMCLVTSAVSNAGSTHAFSHRFLFYRQGSFQSLPVQIQNLGQAQSEYRVTPSTSCMSQAFDTIIHEARTQYGDISTSDVVQRIQAALQTNLRNVISEVEFSEVQIHELETEIQQLEQELQVRKISLETSKIAASNVNLMEVCDSSSSDPIPPFVNTSSTSNHIDSVMIMDVENSPDTCKKSVTKDDDHEDAKNDPFEYVTEMKREMSKPKSPIASPGIGTGKQPSDRGRVGGLRGVGRGRGKQTQSKFQVDNKETNDSSRHLRINDISSSPPEPSPVKTRSANTTQTPKKCTNTSQNSPRSKLQSSTNMPGK